VRRGELGKGNDAAPIGLFSFLSQICDDFDRKWKSCNTVKAKSDAAESWPNRMNGRLTPKSLTRSQSGSG
jgi:hypothetical protein